MQNLDAASLEPYVQRLQDHFCKGSKSDRDSADDQVGTRPLGMCSHVPVGAADTLAFCLICLICLICLTSLLFNASCRSLHVCARCFPHDSDWLQEIEKARPVAVEQMCNMAAIRTVPASIKTGVLKFLAVHAFFVVDKAALGKVIPDSTFPLVPFAGVHTEL